MNRRSFLALLAAVFVAPVAFVAPNAFGKYFVNSGTGAITGEHGPELVMPQPQAWIEAEELVKMKGVTFTRDVHDLPSEDNKWRRVKPRRSYLEVAGQRFEIIPLGGKYWHIPMWRDFNRARQLIGT